MANYAKQVVLFDIAVTYATSYREFIRPFDRMLNFAMDKPKACIQPTQQEHDSRFAEYKGTRIELNALC